jgi:uncharacterized protein YcfL
MKKLLLAITLVFSLLLAGASSHQAAMEDTSTEIAGVIKNVSVNVHLVVINVSEQEGKKSEPSIRSVSVAPHPPITVNGKVYNHCL